MAARKDVAKAATPIERNERAILRELVIAGRAGLSNTALAERVQLTPQGVINIVDSEAWKPFVERRDLPTTGSGRPGRAALPVALKDDAIVIVGVDLGHHAVKVGLSDISGNWLWRPPGAAENSPDVTVEIDADHEPYAAIRWAAASAKRQLDAIGGDPRRVGAVSIGLAAPVDARRGTARSLSGAGEWEAISFLARFEQHLDWHCHYVISNDAALGARAELLWGRARNKSAAGKPGYRHAIYVRWTLGIGGGLIVDGKVYEGSHGASGEIGHSMVVSEPNDERWVDPWTLDGKYRCSRGCGHACLEAVASTEAIVTEIRSALGSGAPTTIGEAIACAREDGPRGDVCRKTFDRAARYLGQVLGAVANALNPETIIIGGDFDEDIDLVEDALLGQLSKSAFGPIRKDVTVVGGSLREGAVIRGTIARALDDAVVEALLDLISAGRAKTQAGGSAPVSGGTSKNGRRSKAATIRTEDERSGDGGQDDGGHDYGPRLDDTGGDRARPKAPTGPS